MLMITFILVTTGLVLLLLSWRELSPSRIFLARPTSPTRDLQPGPVEVAGVIRADGAAPVKSGTGTDCVLVHTIVEHKEGNNYREVSHDTVAVPALLTDSTGSCTVSLAHLDLMGEIWELRERLGQRVTQIIVPDGATVLVAGLAQPSDQAKGSDYREGSRRLAVGGTEAEPLLLSVGGQGRAVWRYGWRAIIAAVCGALLLVLGAGAGYLHAML